jgi:hypothetical protein
MGFRNIVCVILLVTFGCLPQQASGAEPKHLPPGVIKALAADEKEYCDQFLGHSRKGCRQTFRANLLSRQLLITPSGQAAILVENSNMGFCGSAGCCLYLFVQQANATFVQVLSQHGDTGVLERVAVLKTVTNGHYDIQKTWADRKTQTIYRWDGARYRIDDKVAT